MSSLPWLLGTAYRIALALLLTGSLAFFPSPASAASVVGNGTAASCTEAAFNTAFFALQATGGEITFNCGAAPVTILFSTLKTVESNITINGGGKVTLSGNNATGLFQIFSGKTLTLSQIVITRGFSPAGALENFGTLVITNSQVVNNTSSDSGGGVSNHGTLTISNSVIAENAADNSGENMSVQYGGGIYSDNGPVTINNSQVLRNIAEDGGGGVAALGSTSLAVNNSLFEGNRATSTFAQGGALVNAESTATSQITGSRFYQNSSSRGGAISVLGGTVGVSQSTIEGNWGAYGGGIRQEGGTLTVEQVKFTRNGYATNGLKVNTGGGALSWGNGTATLSRVTIHDNWASYGGGFDHENGITTLTNVTISGNQAVGSGGFDTNGGTVNLVNVSVVQNGAGFFGGGIGNRNGTVVLKNTLLSGNYNTSSLQPWNCNKAVAGASFSLSSDFTCALGTGRDNVNLKLGPAAEVDQYARIYPLMPGSPAIDTALGLDCPPVDQRGMSRPQGTACDIGAFEAAANDLLYRVRIPYVSR